MNHCADRFEDTEILFSGVGSSGSISRKGRVKIDEIGPVWFAEASDDRLPAFDTIIGIDSGLDAVISENSEARIRGKTLLYHSCQV